MYSHRLLACLALLIAQDALAQEPAVRGDADAAQIAQSSDFSMTSDQPDLYQRRALSDPNRSVPEKVATPAIPPLPARRSEDVKSVKAEAESLRRQGRYSEAQPLLKRIADAYARGAAKDRTEMAEAIGRLAWVEQALGRYGEAEPHYRRAIAILEKTAGPDAPLTAGVLDDLATLHIAQERYGDAEPLIKRALAIREKALGAEHPDTAKGLDTLGALTLAQRRLDDADAPLTRALAIREKTLGAEHPDTAGSLARLATLRYRQQRIPEAQPLAERALAIREKVLGPDHPDTADSLDRIAALHVNGKRYREAEPLVKRALAIRERAFAEEHPATLDTLDRMGSLFMLDRRFDEAEASIRRTLAIRERVFGLEHPSTAVSYEQLGLLSSYRGDDDQVTAFHSRALAIREKAFGPEDPRIVDSLLSKARYVKSRDESDGFYARALAIQEKAFGAADARTVETLVSLLTRYRLQGRLNEATALGERLLAAAQAQGQGDTAGVVRILDGLGELYTPAIASMSVKPKHAEAAAALRRALTIRERTLGSDHTEIAERCLRLANIYAEMRQVEDAEQFYKRALAVAEKVFGPDDLKTSSYLPPLARFYTEQKRPGDAEQAYLRYVAISEKALRQNARNADLALQLSSLQMIYRGQNRLAEMEGIYRRFTAISEELKKTDAPDHGYFKRLLAGFYIEQRRFVEAEILLLSDLSVQERGLAAGNKSVDFDANVRQLEEIYQKDSRTADSEALHKRMLALMERTHGPDSFQARQAVVKLEAFLGRQGERRSAEREPLLQRLVAISEKQKGADSAEIVFDLERLATFYAENDRENQAEPILKSVIAIMEKSEAAGPANRPTFSLDSVVSKLQKLAAFYQNQNRHADAEPILRRGLDIVVKQHGAEQRDSIRWLVDLAKTREKQGDEPQAEQLLKRAAAIEEKALLSDERPRLSTTWAFDAVRAFYQDRERDAEFEAFLKARMPVEEKALASGAIRHLAAAPGLCGVYRRQNRAAECEALLKRELEIKEQAHGADDSTTLQSVAALASFYDAQGREAEAGALYERRYNERVKAVGAEHDETLSTRNNVAKSYMEQGRYEEAEKTYREILAGHAKASTPDPAWLARYIDTFRGLERLYTGTGRTEESEALWQSAAALIDSKLLSSTGRNFTDLYPRVVEFYRNHWRYLEAIEIAKRWLAVKSVQPSEAGLLEPLLALGRLYQSQERYGEAEPVLKRALAIAESEEGPESKKTFDALLALAALYRLQGRHDEAEPLNLRAVALAEAVHRKTEASSLNKAKRPWDTKGRIADSLNSLAVLRLAQNRYSEAEEALKRAIDLQEQQSGRQTAATAIHNLGALYASLSRASEAEPLLKRALQIRETQVGAEHPANTAPLHVLGQLYISQGLYPEAEAILGRALAISERVNGPVHPTTLELEVSMARVYRFLNRHAEAETLLKRVLAGREKAHGPDATLTMEAVRDMMLLYLDTDRLADADHLAGRLREAEKAGENNRRAIAHNQFILAHYEEKRGNWPESLRLRESAAGLLIEQARRRNAGEAASPQEEGTSELRIFQSGLIALVRSAAQLGKAEPARMEALAAQGFEMAQWARHSDAAAALAQTSARFARGDDQLAVLVRRRQDLVSRFKAIDGDLVTSFASEDDAGVSWKKRRGRQDDIWRERARIEEAIRQTDAELKVKFPDYAALANPEPLTLAQAQAQLRPQEALYQIALDKDAAYAWVVTKDAMRWHTLPLGSQALADGVATLRCGLDTGSWVDETGGTVPVARGDVPQGKDCRQLTGQNASGAALPFDLARAHELYKALFAPFDDLIRDKHLLVVTPGPLAALPLQVLVTEAPDPTLRGLERYAGAAWLAKRQAVTVLPSVASLRVLRAATRRRAAHPYAGFGNPLLAGFDGNDRRAWEMKDCSVTVSSLSGAADGALARRLAREGRPPASPRGGLQQFYRGGLADVTMIKHQQPLPETADELCSVATALGGNGADVFLGAEASESALKAFSKQGRLGASRVVHFATHGLIGGETEILTRSRLEPALIMTPPDQASEEDDGLLTASEAAQLSLNADLVILSACNTAAGDGKAGGEALSGLARAFLYAGSRALLASHWYVNSEAAVELVSGMFAEGGKTPEIGLAEALRRAMVARIHSGGFRSHPSYWAPFVIVGEGG